MYSHILFDMDDTLFDFQKAQLVSFKCVLEKYSIQFSQAIYDSYQGINHNLWHQFESGHLSKDDVQNERFTQFFQTIHRSINGTQANSIYQECLARQTWLVPYAKETCMELSKDHTLYIITNGVGTTQKRRFALSDISPYFAGILISEDIGYSKPDKKFFDETFKLINCEEKEKMLVVGDSISSDIQGANVAGIDCCWFNQNGIDVDSQVQITYKITELRQLIHIVKE